MRQSNKNALWLVAGLFTGISYVTFIGAVGYVLYHFISKFW